MRGTTTTSSTTTGDGATGELPVDTLMDEAQRLQRIEIMKEALLRAHPEFTDADVIAEWSQPSCRAIEVGRKVHSESRSAALSITAAAAAQVHESLLAPLNSTMEYAHHLAQPLEDSLRQIPNPKIQWGFWLKDKASDALQEGTQRLTLGIQHRLTDWSGSATFGETVAPIATELTLMAATDGLARGLLKVPALARSGLHKVQQYELKFHPGVLSSNGAGSFSIQKRSTAYQGRARGRPHLESDLPKEMTVGGHQGPWFPTLLKHADEHGRGVSSTEY